MSKKFKNTPHDFAISVLKFKDNSLAKICSNFSSSTDHHHLFNVYAENTSFIKGTEVLNTLEKRTKNLK